MGDTYKLRSVGGALIVTIPQHIVRFAKLKAGTLVAITCNKYGLIQVEKQPEKKNAKRN